VTILFAVELCIPFLHFNDAFNVAVGVVSGTHLQTLVEIELKSCNITSKHNLTMFTLQ